MRRIMTLLGSMFLLALTGAAVADDWRLAASQGKPEILNLDKNVLDLPGVLNSGLVSGNVLLQFRIDDVGKAQDVRVILTEPRGVFDKHARGVLSRLRFSLPPDWMASHPKRLHELAFLYATDTCVIKDPFPGISMLTFDTRLVDSRRQADKMREICEKKRASSSPARESTQ